MIQDLVILKTPLNPPVDNRRRTGTETPAVFVTAGPVNRQQSSPNDNDLKCAAANSAQWQALGSFALLFFENTRVRRHYRKSQMAQYKSWRSLWRSSK